MLIIFKLFAETIKLREIVVNNLFCVCVFFFARFCTVKGKFIYYLIEWP